MIRLHVIGCFFCCIFVGLPWVLPAINEVRITGYYNNVDTNLYKMVVQKYGVAQQRIVDSLVNVNKKGLIDSENLVIDLRKRTDFEELSLENLLYEFSKKGLTKNTGIQTGLIATWQNLQNAKKYLNNIKASVSGLWGEETEKKKKKKNWVLVVTDNKLFWLIQK